MVEGLDCDLAFTCQSLNFDDWFDTHFHNMVSVALMLIIYGIAFIYLEKRNKARAIEPSVTELDKLPYTTAFYIGLFQVLALYQGLAVLEQRSSVVC